MTLVGMLLASTLTGAPDACSVLCADSGRLTFVERLADADVRVRFVGRGEDVRLRYRTYPSTPGEWRVVGANERYDVAAYVEQYGGPDVVDVRVVKYGPRCM